MQTYKIMVKIKTYAIKLCVVQLVIKHYLCQVYGLFIFRAFQLSWSKMDIWASSVGYDL